MFAHRLRRYAGLLGLVGGLVLFILITLMTSIYSHARWVSIDNISVSQSRSLQQTLLRMGADETSVRAEILAHVKRVRDGGELVTRSGSVYQFPRSSDAVLRQAAAAVEKSVSASAVGEPEKMTQSFNAFVAAQAQSAQRRASYLTAFQIGAAVFTVMSFLGILFVLLFRLGKADDTVETTLAENQNILRTTKDGLFMIDKQLQIGSVQSQAAKNLFGRDHKLKGSFLDIIQPLVSADDLRDTKEYVSLLFECRGRPSLLTSLNPLREVEITLMTAQKHLNKRFISFDFSRNAHDSSPRLLVAVSDITKEVFLKRELDEVNQRKHQHFEKLMSSIVASNEEVSNFYQASYTALHSVNDILQDERGAFFDNRHKLRAIGATIHRIKGNAAVIGMSVVEQSAHDFESKIAQIKALPKIEEKQIASLSIMLQQMIKELEFLEQLSAKLADAAANHPTPSLTQVRQLTEQDNLKLKLFADEIAKRENKQVNLETRGFKNMRFTAKAQREIDSLCAQLIRNAIAHGIEETELRQQRNKPLAGQITIALKEHDAQSFKLVVRDDGGGLNMKKIKASAIDQGLISAQQAEQLSNSETVRLIFHPNFSTKQSASLQAGRGYGLEVVREDVLKLGGSIGVRSSRGLFSQFSIILPRTMMLSVAA